MVLEENPKTTDSSKEVIALLREIAKSLSESRHVQEERLGRIEAWLPDRGARTDHNRQNNELDREKIGEVEENGALGGLMQMIGGIGGSIDDFDTRLHDSATFLQAPLGDANAKNDEAIHGPQAPWQTPWQGGSTDLLAAESSFLETSKDWRRWFVENMWIPSDPRLPLMFDIDRIKQCRNVSDAIAISKKLHAFNQVLCGNGGGFLVVDNIGPGNDKLWGNSRPAKNKRSMYFFDGHMYLSKSRDSETSSIDMETKPKVPERRLIIIDGLVDLRSKEIGDDRSLVSLENFFGAPQPTGLAHNVLGPLYLNSFPHFHRGDLSHEGNYRFCYSWFRIVERSRVRITEPKISDRTLFRDSRRKGNILRAGYLYGSEKGFHMITRDSYLELDMVYAKQSDQSANGMFKSWTAVNLRMPFSRHSPIVPTATFQAQLQVMNQSNEALIWIEEDTRAIADHIDNLLGIGDNILMDPHAHDNLLFDDDTFSRSRRYWWVLNMLTALRQGISETLRVRQEIRELIIDPLSHKNWSKEAHEVLRTDNIIFKRLTKIQHRLENQHQRAEILRSGLFNASGVVESRASTRLGEIVKLLTYVSIFYLPLSFATSLWQTTPFFQSLDNGALVAAMLITGIATYLLVFNLNNLVHTCGAWYERAKIPWLARMQDPAYTSEEWASRAQKYGGFHHRRADSRPSEWWVVWYVVSWPMRVVTRRVGSRISKQDWDPELDTYMRDFFPSLPDMVRKTELQDGWMTPMPEDGERIRQSGESGSQRKEERSSVKKNDAPSLDNSRDVSANGRFDTVLKKKLVKVGSMTKSK